MFDLSSIKRTINKGGLAMLLRWYSAENIQSGATSPRVSKLAAYSASNALTLKRAASPNKKGGQEAALYFS